MADRQLVGALAPIDIVLGVPYGSVPDWPDIGSSRRRGEQVVADPWTALESAVLEALECPPAVVAFSGGRDSSLVLAVATSAARQHGLPDPVPVTMRFASAPASAEPVWQELVIGHLGLADWEVLNLEDDLDLLGEIATHRLQTRGLRSPPNTHSMTPVARRAVGGSLITGIGGDDLLARWRWRPRGAFISGTDRQPAALVTTVVGSLPRSVRRTIFRQRAKAALEDGKLGYSWLTEEGRRALIPHLVDREDQPRTWPGFLPWAVRRRSTALGVLAIDELGHDVGCRVCTPLIDPWFIEALGRAGGRWGFLNRTAAMQAIAGSRLPAALLGRKGKALFHQVFWGPRSQRFAASWDGCHVDDHLVDREALKRVWLSDVPDFRSFLLLHDIWLRTQSAARALA